MADTRLVVASEPLAISSVDKLALAEVVQENLGGGSLSSPFALDRVKLPGSGSTNWTIPSLDEERTSKSLDGVLIHKRPSRAWWKTPLESSGGGTPPDCRSDDGITGSNPDLTSDRTLPICARCPYNEWGSSPKGKGKACRELRLLFVLPVDSWLPLLFACPTTSLGALQKYLQRLTAAARPYWSVRTRLELEKVTSIGPAYARIVPKLLGLLTEADVGAVREYRRALVPYLDRAAPAPEDFSQQ